MSEDRAAIYSACGEFPASDLLMAADSGLLTILILLDLTAAFDTISHSILLERLISIGITGISHDWFKSYLSGRTQFVEIKQFKSRISQITSGVPQGSVLGPLLFIVYLLPLGQIFRKFNINFHCYADEPRSSQPQFRKTRSSQPRLKLRCACITMTTVITRTTQRGRAFRALFF